WYQAGRGNAVGASRQLEKGLRRLEAFEPEHRGVDVAEVRRQLHSAQALVEGGSLDLPPPTV
ncbi:MAG TPA: hypothetical protein VIG35_06025, partial [Gaiellaceae bacterium]